MTSSHRAKLVKSAHSLDGHFLQAILNDWFSLKPRKKPSPSWLEREQILYGNSFPKELQTLLTLEAGVDLDEYGDFRAELKMPAFFFSDPDSAKKHLRQARKNLWGVYFREHFLGLYPIGTDGGGNLFWAQLAPATSSSSKLYCFDHEEGRLYFLHYSLSEFFYAQTFCKAEGAFDRTCWDHTIRTYRSQRRKQKLARMEDPIWLEKRSRWLVSVITLDDLDELTEQFRLAPSLSVWQQEKELLISHPHLALYWLFAHAILQNQEELEEAIDQTKTSKNVFVKSLRDLIQNEFPLSKDSLSQARKEAPSRLLSAATKKREKQTEVQTQKNRNKEQPLIIEK